MPARKLAETNTQIEALRRHVLAQCVAITSSIDRIPPEMVLPEMRARWLRELRQAGGALVLVVERLSPGPYQPCQVRALAGVDGGDRPFCGLIEHRVAHGGKASARVNRERPWIGGHLRFLLAPGSLAS
jgi:hypothetical protein